MWPLLVVVAAVAAVAAEDTNVTCGAAVQKSIAWCVPASTGSVATDGDRYFVLHGSTLTAYTEAGDQLWKFSATYMSLGATAILATDSTYLYSLYKDTGTVNWSVPLSSYFAQLQCSSGGTVFANKYCVTELMVFLKQLS
jgi:outer membrane protein assembly factor BamB